MAKLNFYNRGSLKGRLTKNEIVNYEGKNGKAGGEFLSLEVDCGDSNKGKATIFNSKAYPNKVRELAGQFPVGTMVNISGNNTEKVFESNGKKGLDRSLGANAIKVLDTEGKIGAIFILQGIVKKLKETRDNSIEVTLELDTSYTREDKTFIERKEEYHLSIEGEKMLDELDELDVENGDNVKFKGQILSKLILDDYDDIIGSENKFKVEKIENVVKKDDLAEEAPEELGL